MTRSASPDGSARPLCPHCGTKHRSLTPDECLDRRMTERALQDSIAGRAKRRGWKVAHAGKGFVGGAEGEGGQFVTPMSPGWPDLMLFKAGMPHPVIAMEVKRDRGEVSEDQWFWLILMNECGIPAIIVRPSDLRVGRITAILDGA